MIELSYKWTCDNPDCPTRSEEVTNGPPPEDWLHFVAMPGQPVACTKTCAQALRTPIAEKAKTDIEKQFDQAIE